MLGLIADCHPELPVFHGHLHRKALRSIFYSLNSNVANTCSNACCSGAMVIEISNYNRTTDGTFFFLIHASNTTKEILIKRMLEEKDIA